VDVVPAQRGVGFRKGGNFIKGKPTKRGGLRKNSRLGTRKTRRGNESSFP